MESEPTEHRHKTPSQGAPKGSMTRPTAVHVRPESVPFHLPHKKIFEQYEVEKEKLEPVAGFSENQRRQKDLFHKSEEEQVHAASKVHKSRRDALKLFLPECSEEEVQEKEDSSKKLKRTSPPDIVDQKELIAFLRNDKKIGCLCMIYAVSRASVLYSPYCLTVVPSEKIHKANFLTISSHGVTQYCEDDVVFTPLDVWEREYDYYCKLIKIKAFKQFRMWKGFFVWRKYCVWRKFCIAQDALERNLVILNPGLQKGLLNIQAVCCKLMDMSFTDVSKMEENALFEFLEVQMGKLEVVRERLAAFYSLAKGIVHNTCHEALLTAGFTTDNSNILKTHTKKLEFRKSKDEVKMTCLQQANKRKFYIQLSCFIRLADYMILHLLYVLSRNSLEDLVRALRRHYHFLPSDTRLHTVEIYKKLEDTRPADVPQLPMFNVDVLINAEEIVLEPSEQVFLYSFNELLDLWDEAVTGINPFLPDPFFHSFTEPVIDGKTAERLCGDGPDLTTVLRQDAYLVKLRRNVIKLFNVNFEAAVVYIQRFEVIRQIIAENKKKSRESIDDEIELRTFRLLLTRYNDQLHSVEQIVEEQPLGILNICLNRFKEAVLPSPAELLSVVEHALPRIGKEKIDALILQAQEAQSCLEMDPKTTLNYVNYLSFLENAPKMVDNMKNEMDYAMELYDIIDEFQVPCASEEQEKFLGFKVTFTALSNFVDKKVNEKTTIIEKFNKQINKDITELFVEVADIKEETNQQWLIDIESNPEEAKVTLDALHDQLAECQKKAAEYRNYQMLFKVEVTQFDMFYDVMNGVKLRQLLWESADLWQKKIEEWSTLNFNQLIPEDMNLITAKVEKDIHLFETSLPPNLIVPKLSENVETMKEKLPVITYLQNPSLKKRHWVQIEQVLNYRFESDEMVTLPHLEMIDVFSHGLELQKISDQASSEAALELLLKKVEENWKFLEFTVIPHRDCKDVYILGGTEEIQQVLDDSFINVNTIASSRYVGPIKMQVEKWLHQLELFSKTLDEWLVCQQSWLYLEPILSAPGIQRQLPNESKIFIIVDKSFREVMRKTAKKSLAMQSCTAPGVLEMFQNNNALLEQIMKCVEAYLESKRVVFPRFYFLSNAELLEILAQAGDPHAVQPHLHKCFDAIAKLEFGRISAGQQEGAAELKGGQGKEVEEDASVAVSGMSRPLDIVTVDIIAMLSPEGEKVGLRKGLKAHGNIEDWLCNVENSMFLSLKKLMLRAITDYDQQPRKSWVLLHPSQIIVTVSQIMWARSIHRIFASDGQNINKLMKEFEDTCSEELNDLAAMVCGNLNKLQRMILSSLITVEVHARDTVTNLVTGKVTNSTSFEWLKQLRCYWDEDINSCVTRMSSAAHVYGYEYLGASPRLVITPLTDKCCLCLVGALQLNLGGALAGPAGTGKTETTKDLAKSLAIQCVVFNCYQGMVYKMMGRFLSGLAQSGAWCCFDEFSRIDMEVLSVTAQLLLTIRKAKAAKLPRFMFEGREIKLVQQCAVFITMNPGYAGRTELPDNLKGLFRPISMMVPDYALIAEVMLYSEGFESSKILASKMVRLYQLCSELLSQQDHYDFGMRAMKSVLVVAGSLKYNNPRLSEDIVIIQALHDSNLPKFLAQDSDIFRGILNDLFPGIVIPEQDCGVLQEAIVTVMQQNVLQAESCMVTKVIQLHDTMLVRHGVMLVGPTGGGKTTVLKVLQNTLAELYNEKINDDYYRPVRTYVLNPKSVTLGELYGEMNPFTLEWKDGLLGILMRTAVQSQTEEHQWIVCDGPADAVWVENMNTVLDDSKMLCLANSERIKLTPYVRMVFEVQDLSQASPATVSRCGMVYIDPDEIKWLPYVRSWLSKLDVTLPEDSLKYIENLFSTYLEPAFAFVKRNCDCAIYQVDISKATMMCKLMESLMKLHSAVDLKEMKTSVKSFLCHSFIFAYIWSVGGNIVDNSREMFEVFIRSQFEEHPDACIPSSGDLWNMYVNIESSRLDLRESLVPVFTYNRNTPVFEMIVPTTETVRVHFIMERLLAVNYPLLLTGLTGVGKSLIAKTVLNDLSGKGEYIAISLNFSAQTSSARAQELIEMKLKKRKKTLLGPPIGKKIVVFVDDVNMPKVDMYGSQPPIELLRQYLDFHGVYDRDKLFWKDIEDVKITAACASLGGERNLLTPRFVRHFGVLFIPSPDNMTLKHIFKSIMHGFLEDFTEPVAELGGSIVDAAVAIYGHISADLLPTPAKSHYVFNLRDLSKCIQGMLQADSKTLRDADHMLRLFYHECLRVFHDRLISIEDRSYFYHLMKELCVRYFSTTVIPLPDDPLIDHPPILIFGDFMQIGATAENKVYEEITDMERLKYVLQDYLEDYNTRTSKKMDLIFFMGCIEHVARIARILRTERGNALLVGLGGRGKHSLTHLGAYLYGYRCFQLELTSNYNHNSFLNDVRRLYFNAGAKNEGTTFLFTDTQIVQEEFLEDISNILNSGEVPNLYDAAEEYEKVIQGIQSSARDAGISDEDRDGIFSFFISRVRCKLHLVLCMSPVGDVFRRRCRMFPSLVNCCTIDWFVDWPQEALLSIAQDALKPLGDEELVNNLADICVIMHESAARAAVRFYEEMRRHYYVTPSSYLQLIKLYKTLLEERKDKINQKKNRICNGLQKLFETNSVVDKLKMELVALEPELKEKSAATAELMECLVKEQSMADKVRQIVLTDEAMVKAKAAETQVLADDAQRDIDAAVPAMETATRALDSITKNEIDELRMFNKPPHLVKFVMEAVCLLMGQKLDWPSAKLVLGDTNFLKKLQEYDKDKISDALLKKLKEYVDHPDFAPEKVATQSKVCKSICMWIRALHMYAEVYRVVEPKRRRLEEAEKELNQVMGVLREKQQHLAEVEKQIAQLETLYDTSLAERTELESVIEMTANRLTRAGRLTSALRDEQLQWEESVKDLGAGLVTLVGDVLVAAGFVTYLGPFTSRYRDELMELWISHCKQLSIPAVETLSSLIAVLADQHEIRQWNACGLPRDRVSTENAILVIQAGRCPLMIDPQEQANQWIRQMDNANGLKTVKLTDSNFMHVLESGIRTGTPVLLEDVGETLDSALGPVLMKQTFFQGGRTMIRLGDTDVDYDNNFRFYVTTRLPNPHYLPEICIQVTLINFTVTPSSLEELLLSDVVHIEQPELEQERNELITRINDDKNQLQTTEDKILKMLYASEGNILDDEDLIVTLDESKERASILASRLVETEATEERICVVREKYRVLATRGSVLYSAVAQLADIDPMYQYSLKYFNQVFKTVIATTDRVEEFVVHLQMLLDKVTLAIYTTVSMGLFARHKLVFSFMLCASIFKQSGIISESQWNFLLHGPVPVGMNVPKKPDIIMLSDSMWQSVNFLATKFKSFEGLPSDALLKICIRIEDFEQVINIQVTNQESARADWNAQLDDFEKLMLLKALKEEKLVSAVTAYIKGKLGQTFVESSEITLHKVYQGTSNVTPVVFLLSTGSDPFEAFQCFANEVGKMDKLQCISLGQGQAPAAEKMISLGAVKGDWVFLQNCHLATSWMLAMERLIQKLSDAQEDVHPDFRLYFSTMPSSAFPVSVLQNAVKVTNEPPKGLRANMKRAFFHLTTDGFEDHPLGPQWRMMIFGICFFHAVIQERKKFGPLGWNVTYEFNDSDRECALNAMKMLCIDNAVPWDALEYITGEIIYGGRVTDYWDLRCLKTILRNFFTPSALVDGYLHSESGMYYCPESVTCSTLAKYRNFVDELPLTEEPEIFGVHENANIPWQVKETHTMIVTIRDIQPRESPESTEKSSDDIVCELAETILGKLVNYIDIRECLPSPLGHDKKGRQPPLSTVLFQEVDRYSSLLIKVYTSLDNLQKASKGLVVMSEALEEVFNSCLNNQIPKMWDAFTYPSLKSLGSWVRDLELRLDFIKVWLTEGAPPSYWLSGFFFPLGFLTGVLQTYARKHNHPIDELKFDFVVLNVILDQENIYAAHMKNEQHEVPAVYGDIVQPEDGVIVHGLFLDAGRWDSGKMELADPYPGEINPPLPAMHILPKPMIEYSGIRYVTPLYKTSVRAGVLSTIGHSTNFVVAVLLASSQPESYWILKGTALLMQITN